MGGRGAVAGITATAKNGTVIKMYAVPGQKNKVYSPAMGVRTIKGGLFEARRNAIKNGMSVANISRKQLAALNKQEETGSPLDSYSGHVARNTRLQRRGWRPQGAQ